MIAALWCACVLLLQEPVQAPRFATQQALRADFVRACQTADDARCRELVASHDYDALLWFDELLASWCEARARDGALAVEPIELASIARAMEEREACAAWSEHLERARRFDARQCAAWIAARRGELSAGSTDDPQFAQALAAFEALDWQPGVARLQIRALQGSTGSPESALALAREAASRTRTLAWPTQEYHALAAQRAALLQLGRSAEAEALVEPIVDAARRTSRLCYLWALYVQGLDLRREGKRAHAHELSRREWTEAGRGDEPDKSSLQRSLILLMSDAIAAGDEEELIELELAQPLLPQDELEVALAGGRREELRALVAGEAGNIYRHRFDQHCVLLAARCYRGQPMEEDLARMRMFTGELGLRGLDEVVERLARMERDDALGLLRANGRLMCGAALPPGDEAVRILSEARALLDAERWPTFRAEAGLKLGSCLRSLGRPQLGLEPLREYRDLAPLGLDGVGSSAHARTLLADLHRQLGDYSSAIRELEEAATLQRAAGREVDLLSLGALASCYLGLGQNERALAAAREALARRDEWIATEGNLLETCGRALAALGRPEEALSSLEQSRVSPYGGETPELSSAMATCLTRLGRTEEAVACARRALAQAEARESQVAISCAASALGDSLLAAGRAHDAIPAFQRALEVQTTLEHHRDCAASERALAEACCSGGDFGAALAHLEACLAHLQRVGRRFLPEEGRSLFLEQWADVPRLASAVVFELVRRGETGALAHGLPLVDSFQARTLLEGLQERSDALLRETNGELVAARERSLDECMSLRVELSSTHEPAERTRLTERLRGREAEADEAEQRLRLANPALDGLMHPLTGSLAELQREVLGPDDALLQYVVGDQASFAWVVTREHAAIVRLAARAELLAQQEELARALDPRGARDSDFVAPARRLHELLLAPLSAEIAGKERLIVVPDEFLAFVPFDALLLRAPEGPADPPAFLLRERTLVYAPSMSFLCRDASAEHSAASREILLVGDPVYAQDRALGDALALRALAELRPERVQRLAATRGEVLSIARSFVGPDEGALLGELDRMARSGKLTGARFELRLGTEATRSRLFPHLGGHRILHLAVHGYVDPEFPWFSGLVLGGEASEPCSFLSLAEIATLDIGSELVFLSACETVAGPIVRSEGLKGTARAFLLAGARQVVATQWTVDDEAAARLAQTFYREYLDGRAVAEALRRAKLEFLDGGRALGGALERGIGSTRLASTRGAPEHPSLWAPFVVWGKPESDRR